jgi:hypothetical protein
MILPDVEKVVAALGPAYADLDDAMKRKARVVVEAVYAAIAAVAAPEPVTPESERWAMPEPKASHPPRGGAPAA